MKNLSKKVGVDMEATGYRFRTLVHRAAENGHVEGLRKLGKLRANMNTKDEFGKTPAHLAALYGHTKALRQLGKLGAKMNAKDDFGSTPAHYAASFGHTKALRCLKELGAYMNAKDEYGITPVYEAIRDIHLETAKYLVEEAGVRVNTINVVHGDEDTLLDIAHGFSSFEKFEGGERGEWKEREGMQEIINFLISKGAKTGREIREEKRQKDLSKKVAYGRAASPCKKGIKVNSRKKSIKNK